MNAAPHGTLAAFATPERLLVAVRRAQAEGWTRFETFAPCPVEGLPELLLPRPSPIPGFMLAGGALGATGGFFLQVWAAFDYPVNVGGRPLFSWPAFVPVTFELGVLSAVFTGLATLLWKCGLPRYEHPAFASPSFRRASIDRFFLYLLDDDPRYSPAAAKIFFAGLEPLALEEIAR